MSARHLWVIEIQAGHKHKEWLPCAEGHLIREDARLAVKYDWRIYNQSDNFRVVKYVPAKEKQ